MADETLNITVVEDNGSTNKLVTAVNNLAKASDALADSTDKSTAASQGANKARDAEAASTAKAAKEAKGYVDAQGNYIRNVGSNTTATRGAVSAQEALTNSMSSTAAATTAAGAAVTPFVSSVSAAAGTGREFNARVAELNASLNGAAAPANNATQAVRGYVDAQGNYIRLVGSQANGVRQAAAAQDELTKATSAGSIEAGRAAAGYGPLNAATATAGASNAAFEARVRSLNAELAGLAPAGAGAAAGVAPIAPAVQGSGAAAQTANGWIAQYRQSLFGVGPAGTQAAQGSAAAGAAAGGAGNGARGGAGGFQDLSAAMRGTQSAASTLATSLAALGVGLSAGSVISAADSYSVMQNKLRLLTTDQTKLNEVMRVSFDIAQRTSTPFEAISTLYGRISMNAGKYRISADDAGKVTETLALAFQASGASGVEAGRAIEQFNQGIAKGKLEVQDFKSIVQAAPAVQNAMLLGLRNIGVAVNGSLSEALSKGTITAEQMLRALASVTGTMRDFAAGAAPTVANAMTRVQNSFIQYIGSANQGNAITGTLIGAMDALGRNMNTVIPIAVGLTGLLAFGVIAGSISAIVGLAGAMGTLATVMGGALVSAIGAVTTGVVTMGAAALANPLLAGAIVVAVGLAAAALYRYGGAMKDAAAGALGLRSSSLAQAEAAYAQAGGATALGTASEQSAAKLAVLKAANDNARTSMAQAQQAITSAREALARTVPGTQENVTAQAALKTALDNGTDAAKKAATAQEALADANNKAAASGKASAVAQALTGSEVNALGEKLTSLSTLMQRHAEEVRAAAEQYKYFQEQALAASQALDKEQASLQNAQTALAATRGLFTSFDASVAGSNASLSQGQSALSGYAQGLGQIGAAAEDATAKLVAGQKAARDFFDMGKSKGIGSLVSEFTPKPIPEGHKTKTIYKEFGGNGYKILQANLIDDGIDWSNYSAQAAAAGAKVAAAGLGDKAAFAAADAVQQQVNSSAVASVTKGSTGAMSMMAFADGGSFIVGGSGGTDSQLVQFMASPNERVTIETPSQRMPARQAAPAMPARRGSQPVIINIKADDFGQFKRSQRQIAQDIGERVARAS